MAVKFWWACSSFIKKQREGSLNKISKNKKIKKKKTLQHDKYKGRQTFSQHWFWILESLKHKDIPKLHNSKQCTDKPLFYLVLYTIFFYLVF